jgi:hypothetical protein
MCWCLDMVHHLWTSNICDAEEHAQILNTFACVKMQRMYMHAQVQMYMHTDVQAI